MFLAKYSPLCRCCLNSTIVYFVLLLVVAIMLAVNVNACGLDANKHVMRMREVTYPVTKEGLVDNVTYKTYDPTFNDTVKYMPINTSQSIALIDQISFEALFSSKYNETVNGVNISRNVTNTSVDQFPLSLVLNYTASGDNEIQGLNFTLRNFTDYADNGSAFDIVIDNPKRKNAKTREAWFNFDEYSSDGLVLIYNGTSVSKTCRSFTFTNITSVNGTDSPNSTTNWVYADSRSNLSTFPLWFIGLENLTAASPDCSKDYWVNIELQSFFCFSPFLVRNVPYQPVTFANIQQYGDFIIDFEEGFDYGKINDAAYVFQNASLDNLWLTSAKSGTLMVNSSGSNISFYVPKQGLISFYGIGGAALSKTSAQRDYY